MDKFGLVGIIPETGIVDTISTFSKEYVEQILNDGQVCVILPRDKIKELCTTGVTFNELTKEKNVSINEFAILCMCLAPLGLASLAVRIWIDIRNDAKAISKHFNLTTKDIRNDDE